jgi:hypothetical protein
LESVNAQEAVEQILDRHEDELRAEVQASLPAAVRALAPEVQLANNVDEVECVLVFPGEAGSQEYLSLQPLSLFELESRYVAGAT